MIPSRGVGPTSGRGQSVGPLPYTGLTALGLSNSALHAFAASLQGVVAAGVSAVVHSPSPSIQTGKVATLSLLHL